MLILLYPIVCDYVQQHAYNRVTKYCDNKSTINFCVAGNDFPFEAFITSPNNVQFLPGIKAV